MVKKILICLSICLVLLVGLGVYALDITDDEEFEELKIDSSFMLDSPLFTQKDETSQYVQNEYDMVADGYEKLLENDNFEFYHSPSRAYSIRVLNKQNGFVWSSDNSTSASKSAFTAKVLDYETGNDITIDSSNANDVIMSHKVKEADNKVVYDVEFKFDDIYFKYEIKLTDSGITLSLLNDTIKEKGANKLLSISFFQYFGSTLGDTVPGYLFIPSGNGGLIRYSSNSLITDKYEVPFYGTDLNYLSEEDSLDDSLSLPIYGFVHGINQNACLVEIKEGDAISVFNYLPAGYNTVQKYTQNYLNFLYRKTYTLKTTSSEFTMVPDEHYESDVVVEYSFLTDEDANYVGMAKQYQKSLVEDGILGNATLSDSTQMHVESFGREYEEGLLFKKYHNMTTIDDLVNINDELKENGVDNILYTLKGYYVGGYSGANPTNVTFEGLLGALSSLDDNNMNYYLYYNPVETNKERIQYPSYNLVNVFRDEVFLTVEEGAKYTFYSDIKTIISGFDNVFNKYGSRVSVDGITSYLYGDYNNNYEREDSLKVYGTILGDKLYPMYSPNAYLLQNTEKHLTTNLYHERMRFITDSVPFTQIVLRGYVDMYSTYLNFSSNQELDVLKCIEYGVYPAYLITEKASHNLSKTLSNDLFATEYGRVKDKMFSQYKFIKGALDSVNGAKIVGREVLALGVVEVTYSNGVSIVVNYNTTGNGYAHSSGKKVENMNYEVILNG